LASTLHDDPMLVQACPIAFIAKPPQFLLPGAVGIDEAQVGGGHFANRP
jgi:hypothetical protein